MTYPFQILRIATVFLIFAVSSGASCFAFGNAQIEEGKYDITDTGIEQSTLYGPIVSGVWLDKNKILLNALQNVPGAQERRLDRVVMLNVDTWEVKTVLEPGRIICREKTSQLAHVVWEGKSQFVRIDSEGHISPLTERPALKESLCKTAEPRFPDRLQTFLNEGDGYIDRGRTGHGFSEDNAVLHRPKQPPLELPVPGGEIASSPVYLPFLNQYLLNYRDSLSGQRIPAGKPVFRLMTPEGEISEIPQPSFFTKLVGSFGRMWMMRDGMVLDRTGPGRPKQGLYFIRGERIIRIYGANGELADRITPSPDGCTFLFLGLKNYDFVTKKTVKLINLCKEK